MLNILLVVDKHRESLKHQFFNQKYLFSFTRHSYIKFFKLLSSGMCDQRVIFKWKCCVSENHTCSILANAREIEMAVTAL